MKPTVSNFLISCLVGIYIFQFYNGYALFMLYFSSAVDCPHWQVSSKLVATEIMKHCHAKPLAQLSKHLQDDIKRAVMKLELE